MSLLDGPLLHTVLPKEASFAVNSQIATAWWVKPFLKAINAYLLEPTRPLAARMLVNAVKGGETIVIFPDGRITVTGSIMKAYDGTAMIADKVDAAIVPVRIDGPERSPFSYLKPSQIRRALSGTKARVARQANDPGVILFTSGSEGVPKAVVLSHRNVLANCAQCLARIDTNGQDLVFNALPVFHSFGLTGGLIMPQVGGVPTFLYPSPVHYRIVPEFIYDTGATVLFGTNTFLAGYARRASLRSRSVRLVVAGAEAVKDDVRTAYMNKFGVRILEGYGVTETEPVLAMNTPIANRPGTVGRLSPLMQARLEPVASVPEGGRIMVKGPNVMLGYYRAENPGVLEPLRDGWYETGDIVTIDAQGFIKIQGRVRRFAKIAGEMISLAAVEALAAQAVPGKEFAVVAVPDARKGEHTVLLTTDASLTRETFSRYAQAKGAPERWCRARSWWWTSCRCWAAARPTTRRQRRWRKSGRQRGRRNRQTARHGVPILPNSDAAAKAHRGNLPGDQAFAREHEASQEREHACSQLLSGLISLQCTIAAALQGFHATFPLLRPHRGCFPVARTRFDACRVRAQRIPGERRGTPATPSDGRAASDEKHGRSGRVRRAVRRRRRGGSAGAGLGLSGEDSFPGWPADQQGRPAVHRGSAAVPERGGSGPRQSRAG